MSLMLGVYRHAITGEAWPAQEHVLCAAHTLQTASRAVATTGARKPRRSGRVPVAESIDRFVETLRHRGFTMPEIRQAVDGVAASIGESKQ